MKESTINYIYFKRKSGELTSCNFEGGHYSQFMADSWNIESFYSPTKEVWELTNGTLETNLYPPNPHPPTQPPTNHPIALWNLLPRNLISKGGWGMGSQNHKHYPHMYVYIHRFSPLILQRDSRSMENGKGHSAFPSRTLSDLSVCLCFCR